MALKAKTPWTLPKAETGEKVNNESTYLYIFEKINKKTTFINTPITSCFHFFPFWLNVLGRNMENIKDTHILKEQLKLGLLT